ncbi:hypothetical protein ACP0F3_29735, partial [Escherichia coli]
KKPFDFDILLARIEARLRFGGTNIIEIDDLIINPDEEKIEYAGEEIESIIFDKNDIFASSFISLSRSLNSFNLFDKSS